MELRPWTLPNLLTFSRLVALPFLIVAIAEGRHGAAFVLFLACALTDIVDGFVARRFNMTSPFGAAFDPIADKLFLMSTFIVLAVPSTPSVVRIPLWLLVLTLFRDLLILVICLVMFLTLDIRSFPPSALGKANTFLEIATLVSILLANLERMPTGVAHVLFHLTAASTVASGIHYIWRSSSSLPRGTGAAEGKGDP